MKKFLLSVILFLGLAVHVNAGQVVTISSEAANIINSLKSSDFVAANTGDPVGKTYLLKFNAKTVDFGDLYKTSVEEFVDSELKFPKNPVSGSFIQVRSTRANKLKKGVCISFIIAITKPNIWSKDILFDENNEGIRLFPDAKIKAGTIIFSPLEKDKKGNIIEKGHIAILLKVTKDFIWVMDQNSYIKLLDSRHEGIIEIHKIMFKSKVNKSSSDEYYDAKNAYNYHVLEIWYVICFNTEEAFASSKLFK